MMENKENRPLDDGMLDSVSGGAWTGNETELSMVCAGCRGIRVFKKDEYGTWRCTECNGKDTMSYFDL